jgi:tetratricopeptide (TPR) repeat protein
LVIIIITFIKHFIFNKTKRTTTENDQNEINNTNLYRPILKNEGKIVLDDLQRSLLESLQAKRYEEVMRIGHSLSLPLMISGNFRDKVSIGKMVDEAAAMTGRKADQIVALIDDIGWPSVELGDLDGAEKYLKHGLILAQEQKDDFYISLAFRHLGAVYRRRKDYQKAGNYFKKALLSANKISDSNRKDASVAGAQYALASLSFHTGHYDDSISRLSEAIELFHRIGDSVGETRAMSKLAGSLLAKGKFEKGKDKYRQALTVARKEAHRHQIVKCLIGLAKISQYENSPDKTVEYLTEAKQLAIEIQAQTELAEIEALQTSLTDKLINNK